MVGGWEWCDRGDILAKLDKARLYVWRKWASLPTEVICKLELIIIMFDCAAAAAYSKANIADTAILERARDK